MPAPQTLTHLGDTVDYDKRDAGTPPSKTVILKKTVEEVKVHAASFSGYKDVQVDGTDNSGDEDTTNDAKFSFAARNGGNADGLVSKSVLPVAPANPTFIFKAPLNGVQQSDTGHNAHLQCV